MLSFLLLSTQYYLYVSENLYNTYVSIEYFISLIYLSSSHTGVVISTTVATEMLKQWAVKPRQGGITGSVRTRRQSVASNIFYYHEMYLVFVFDMDITVTCFSASGKIEDITVGHLACPHPVVSMVK